MALVENMRANPRNIRFSDLHKVCETYFGKPRTVGSHFIFDIKWQGVPNINIQNDNGKAKAYQVRQVLKAIDRLQEEGGQDG
ncbi:MAG: toxin HicA [Atribacterota bacterium]|nr:toxin HicA [Atribacterota bacterium]